MRRVLAPLLIAAALASPLAAQAPAPSAEAIAPAPADPARLAIARHIMLKLMPDGTYRKLMGGTMQQMMGRMSDSAMELPLRSVLAETGLTAEQKAKIGPGTLGEMMKIIDPAYHERQKLTMDIMLDEISTIVSAMEPELREAMAGAYARRFDEGQLHEIDAFFATPTGAAYAGSYMTMMSDPAIAAKMQAMLPQMMKAMPAIIQKTQAATAKLPKPRKIDDLSAAERSELARLMGTELPAAPQKKVPHT